MASILNSGRSYLITAVIIVIDREERGVIVSKPREKLELIEMAEPGCLPDFGTSVNPISTKGADYAPYISTRPPDFQTLLDPCLGNIKINFSLKTFQLLLSSQ